MARHYISIKQHIHKCKLLVFMKYSPQNSYPRENTLYMHLQGQVNAQNLQLTQSSHFGHLFYIQYKRAFLFLSANTSYALMLKLAAKNYA